MTRPADVRGSLLSLDELARRTGVPPATLLAWGRDHGFPAPELLEGAQGLYAEGDASAVLLALAERDAGAPLREALARAKAAGGPGRSLFRAVQDACPGLVRHVLTRSPLMALCRAVEDAAYHRGEDMLVVGGFQREAFFRDSSPRWHALADRCADVVAFADFPATRRSHGVVEVSGSWEDPFIREWFVLADCRDLQAVIVAVERSDRPGRRHPGRTFETLWTTDPTAVRAALGAVRARLPAADADLGALVGDRITEGRGRPDPTQVERLLQRAFAAFSHEVLTKAGPTPAPVRDRQPAAAAEHRSLAARLHDDALQRLLALRQDLEELEVPGDALHAARSSLAATIAEIRDIVAGVPPAADGPTGLRSGLAAVAARVEVRMGIAVELRVGDDVPDEAHVELLVALARELATNSGLHAHASTVTIVLSRTADALMLSVKDDGFGFSPQTRARATAAGHMGLGLAAERAEAAGGSLRIEGHAPGGGALVEATLPLR